MECDIELKYGNTSLSINKNESSSELSSLYDIAKFLIDNKRNVKNFINSLMVSDKTFHVTQDLLDKKQLIGNTTIDYLKYLYEEEMEIFDKIPNPQSYNITLINNSYINAKSLRGRNILNGEVTYILRNKYDVQNFAITEYIKYLVSQTVVENSINDEYLSKKYSNKLNFIKSKYEAQIKNRLEEEGITKSQITIYDLLIDYLHNKNEYTENIRQDDLIIDVDSTLHDFCKQLQRERIYEESNESQIARKLRSIHWKREEFGKKEFFDVLLEFADLRQNGVLEAYTKGKALYDITKEDLIAIMEEFFYNDYIMSRYQVLNVDTTGLSSKDLTKTQVEKAVKNFNEKHKKEIKLEDITTVAQAIEHFGTNLKYTKDNKSYHVQFRTHKGKLKFFYNRKTLNNDDKITLKYVGKTLEQEFDFIGYSDTFKAFKPINNGDNIYKGWYIYEYTYPTTKNTIYFVSKHLKFPQLYNPRKCNSIQEAELIIDGYVRDANVEKETNINVKKFIDNPVNDVSTRSAEIPFRISAGQILQSRQFPINPNTVLYGEEQSLIKYKKYDQIIQYYKDILGLDISGLTTAEDLGIFLYAAIEQNLSIEKIKNRSDKEAMQKEIDSLIQSINDKPIIKYLVESWRDLNANKSTNKIRYEATLSRIPDDIINKINEDVDVPKQVLNVALHKLKTNLEETIFKNTKVQIHIISSIDALKLKNDDNHNIFSSEDDLKGVKGFVHNNNIYLIKENTRLNDLVHETLHIVLGAIRDSDYDLYSTCLKYFEEDSSSFKPNDSYNNLSQIDRLEEQVVRYLANKIINNKAFTNPSEITDIDKLIMNLFMNTNKTISKSIKGDNNTFDIGFKTKLALLNDDTALDRMKKRRIAINIIKDNLGQTITREGTDC